MFIDDKPPFPCPRRSPIAVLVDILYWSLILALSVVAAGAISRLLYGAFIAGWQTIGQLTDSLPH